MLSKRPGFARAVDFGIWFAAVGFVASSATYYLDPVVSANFSGNLTPVLIGFGGAVVAALKSAA